MRTALVITFLLALLVAGCTLLPDPMPPRPVPADPSACPAICAHLRELHCPDGQPTPLGRTCEDVCTSGLASGLVNWDPDCMRHLPTCDESSCSRPAP